MSLLTKAKHEVREVGLVTVYLLFCFGVSWRSTIN